MVGQGVLLECIGHKSISSILVVGRSSCGVNHAKVDEIIHSDFADYVAIEDRLVGLDACFFCLGVSAAGMSEEDYRHVTYDFAVGAAEILARLNSEIVFCYVSGAGTDSSEKGRTMWARVKGMTENHLLKMPFDSAYMFRPGYIQPKKGVRSKTRLYQAMYTVLSPLYPIWKTLFPSFVTTTEKVGLAMIQVAENGFSKPVLETRDINALASDSH